MSVEFRDRVDGGACPTFFRACCAEASCGWDHGHRVGYDRPGYHLMLHVEELFPYGVQDDEQEVAMDVLRHAVEAQDDAEVLAWLCKWLPRCMALVPKRRRGSFLKGVYLCAAQRYEWIDVDVLDA